MAEAINGKPGTEGKPATRLLDELEKGPWPSFVNRNQVGLRGPATVAKDLLGQLELSYEEKKGHWKHGGLVGVLGYGGGVIGRYSDVPRAVPEGCSLSHHARQSACRLVLHERGAAHHLRYLGEARLRADQYARLDRRHGSAGHDDRPVGAYLPGTRRMPGFDLGGSGSGVRTPSCCVGMARCEWACYDTMKLCYDLTMAYQDELHRPAFPYKFKIKCAGCPNDCVASIARADLSIIGTWKDEIQQDDAEVAKYAAAGIDIQQGRLRSLPHEVHGVGRQEADHRATANACAACTAST